MRREWSSLTNGDSSRSTAAPRNTLMDLAERSVDQQAAASLLMSPGHQQLLRKDGGLVRTMSDAYADAAKMRSQNSLPNSKAGSSASFRICLNPLVRTGPSKRSRRRLTPLSTRRPCWSPVKLHRSLTRETLAFSSTTYAPCSLAISGRHLLARPVKENRQDQRCVGDTPNSV